MKDVWAAYNGWVEDDVVFVLVEAEDEDEARELALQAFEDRAQGQEGFARVKSVERISFPWHGPGSIALIAFNNAAISRA